MVLREVGIILEDWACWTHISKFDSCNESPNGSESILSSMFCFFFRIKTSGAEAMVRLNMLTGLFLQFTNL